MSVGLYTGTQSIPTFTTLFDNGTFPVVAFNYHVVQTATYQSKIPFTSAYDGTGLYLGSFLYRSTSSYQSTFVGKFDPLTGANIWQKYQSGSSRGNPSDAGMAGELTVNTYTKTIYASNSLTVSSAYISRFNSTTGATLFMGYYNLQYVSYGVTLIPNNNNGNMVLYY